MSSSAFFGLQAHIWYAYTHADKTLIYVDPRASVRPSQRPRIKVACLWWPTPLMAALKAEAAGAL